MRNQRSFSLEFKRQVVQELLSGGSSPAQLCRRQMRLDHPISLLSRMLNVSPSGYYGWLDRPPSERAREEMRLEVEIMAADQRTRHTYGSERLQHDLEAQGIRVGICRIRRIRKKLGIRCKQKRKFKATTDSGHKLPVAENLLGQRFEASQPDNVWLSDITYIPTDEGWLYLAGHKDLCTGEIVGYAMSARLTKSLVNESLFRAIEYRHPSTGLMHHSDRGSQYCSYEFRDMLDHYGLQISMSG